ncbi:MAG: nucleotidyltransferase family protein [Rhodobacteraceae bacterium]|nr:nucleotidyltransferase family protein [Paracoccaceae bacterium]
MPIVILAAGASTRMGARDKLLEPVGHTPLLIERIRAAEKTRQPVLVALPPQSAKPERWGCLAGTKAQPVEIANADLGMSASLKGCITALPDKAEGALIIPADMPDISTADMNAILNAFDGTRVVRGSSRTHPGHPVLFPRSWFGRLEKLSGDKGARDLLKNADPLLIALPEKHALTDLDTPQDWATWRAQNSGD